MMNSKKYNYSILINGLVQGVGFRPFIKVISDKFGLAGSVRNSDGIVNIQLEATETEFKNWLNCIYQNLPPMAVIDKVDSTRSELLAKNINSGFHVTDSSSATEISRQDTDSCISRIPKDSAPCQYCIDDLTNMDNRRYQYPFTCCAHCGPRYSILRKFPFDRKHTSMEEFSLCPECEKEYRKSSDRRFYAQTISCPNCGPKLSYYSFDKKLIDDNEQSLKQAVDCLEQGGVLLLKGVGGYQLMCRSDSEGAVERLRSIKHRTKKAFAVMVSNVEKALNYAVLSKIGKSTICSSIALILLAEKSAFTKSSYLNGLAPDSGDLGIMLPSSPLHYLITTAFEVPLVCTSANLAGQPMIISEEVALQIQHKVDGVLTHSRKILHRVDDSIYRDMGDHVLCMRLGRGNSPQSYNSDTNVQVLGVGAQLKSTVCLSTRYHLYVSPYLGDLGSIASIDNYEDEISSLKSLVRNEALTSVHDTHPDFYSTNLAKSFKQSTAVQHHRAHILSCAFEHGISLNHPVLAFCWDGFGYGDNGESWGGQCFHGPLNNLKVIADLAAVFNEKDLASRAPWRSLVSHLVSAGVIKTRVNKILARDFKTGSPDSFKRIVDLIDSRPRNLNSMGRLFDAVAALLGLVDSGMEYEGQAAMKLEAAAERLIHKEYYEYAWVKDSLGNFHLELSQSWLKCLDDWEGHNRHLNEPGADKVSYIARRWFNTIIEAHKELVVLLLKENIVNISTPILLSGGCFQNRILSNGLKYALESIGCQIYRHSAVPCNDSGISVGQAYAASFSLSHSVNKNGAGIQCV